jgi:hypothetical protein
MSKLRKLECECDNGVLPATDGPGVDYCHECDWEECCVSPECDNLNGLGDDGLCDECSLDRDIAKADALYDAIRHGDYED